jgi:hypothetical protein
MEDYAPSDRSTAGPPIGAENMSSLYDRAVEYATTGLALAPSADKTRDLLASRARAHHGHAVREKVFPATDTTGGGLVHDPNATQDALAALALDEGDWAFAFPFESGVVESRTSAEYPFNLLLGRRYAVSTPAGQVLEVTLLDPIDGVPDPWLEEFILAFASPPGGDRDNLTLPALSAKEMRLIVAESALARGDTVLFAEQINATRAYRGVSPWTPGTEVEARDMLIYERQSQLFLRGRRWLDLYRFGIRSDSWESGSTAATTPGTLFPIPQSEVDSNCHLNPDDPC